MEMWFHLSLKYVNGYKRKVVVEKSETTSCIHVGVLSS